MRVMTFNTEREATKQSYEHVVRTILAARADVVGLQEVDEALIPIAEKLGWEYDIRAQVISRYSLTYASGNWVYVHLSDEKVLLFTSIHLYSTRYGPYSKLSVAKVLENEKRIRVPNLEVRLSALSNLCENIPTVLVGDFNSPSHLDDTRVEWPATKLMEESGFVDSYRKIHPDRDMYPGLTWWAPRAYWLKQTPEDKPRHRIDYVYTRNCTVLNSEVVGERHTPSVDIVVYPWYSDHRGVVTEILV